MQNLGNKQNKKYLECRKRLMVFPVFFLVILSFIFQSVPSIGASNLEPNSLDKTMDPEIVRTEDLDFVFEKVAQYYFEIKLEISNLNLEEFDYNHRVLILEMKNKMSTLDNNLRAVESDLGTLSNGYQKSRTKLKKSILNQLQGIEEKILDIETSLNAIIENDWNQDRADLDRKIVEGIILQ
jgi:hypothetical protein